MACYNGNWYLQFDVIDWYHPMELGLVWKRLSLHLSLLYPYKNKTEYFWHNKLKLRIIYIVKIASESTVKINSLYDSSKICSISVAISKRFGMGHLWMPRRQTEKPQLRRRLFRWKALKMSRIKCNKIIKINYRIIITSIEHRPSFRAFRCVAIFFEFPTRHHRLVFKTE